MEEWLILSHQYELSTPGFGGIQGFFREEQSSIAKGRNSNSERWTLSNHHGTHIDCPYHFDNNGKKLTDYRADDWIFNHPYLITINPNESDIIDLLVERESIPEETDILIIKTNFEQFRSENKYWNANPGLSPELGQWIINYRPKIKVLGFDFISLTAFAKRSIGKEAHIVFLTNGIRIIEDMKLSALNKNPEQLIVSPLFVLNTDGAPVTIWAKN